MRRAERCRRMIECEDETAADARADRASSISARSGATATWQLSNRRIIPGLTNVSWRRPCPLGACGGITSRNGTFVAVAAAQ